MAIPVRFTVTSGLPTAAWNWFGGRVRDLEARNIYLNLQYFAGRTASLIGANCAGRSRRRKSGRVGESMPAATVIVSVGVATIATAPTSAVEGTVTVRVSVAVMS
jgi:hypothetical protein